MGNAYLKIDNQIAIQKENNTDSHFLRADLNTFEITAISSPIIGTTNSTKDNLNSEQLAIYNGSTKLWGITDTGWVVNPTRPCFFVTPSADYTPGTSTEVLRADYALYNVGNMYDTSTYRFTAPMEGLYLFGGVYRKDANLSYIHWELHLNGSNVSSSTHGLIGLNTTGYSAFTAGSMSYQIILSAGDYIDFYVYNNSTTAISQQSYLHGVFLG